MALTVSKMTGGSNAHETTSEEANGLATDFVSEGIIGSYSNTGGVAPATGAFAVNAQGTPDMTVAVSSGVAYVTGTPTSQNSQTFRVYNSASENVTISANSSGSTKYDWVYIKLDATLLANPTLAGTTTATLVTSRSTSAGTDDGTPPTYGYPVAVVTVANGAVSITNSTIRDIRATASIGTAAGIATGWNETGLPAVSSVTNNGNKSYDIVFASTVASLLSPGMRLRTTRTVTAPTQCADLEASSSQYFSKTTPNKLTFTDDFTMMGWVKLESYTQGGIIGRRNADTEGFSLGVNSSGQVFGVGLRIAGNNKTATSYQSIPLNKWTHVALTMDLSGDNYNCYIDGVSVPVTVTVNGTATAIVQGTTALTVGALKSAGTDPFDGKIAQAAVFSAVLSASTIRSYMSQTLSGSETNLASAYSCNNSLLDLNTTTPNDLTASGGALMTNTDSPFGQDSNGVTAGTTDYELVMKVNGATATVQVPEGCTIPTSGGVSAVAYSTATSPFGFTLDKGRWEVTFLLKTQLSAGAVASSATVTNFPTVYITTPVGSGDLDFNCWGQITHAGIANLLMIMGLSTTNNSFTDTDLITRSSSVSTSVTEVDGLFAKMKRITNTGATVYYLNGQSQQNNTTQFVNGSTSGTAVIRFTPAGV